MYSLRALPYPDTLSSADYGRSSYVQYCVEEEQLKKKKGKKNDDMYSQHSSARSTHECHNHANPYPRVVPYTHTTAFMVMPTASQLRVEVPPPPTAARSAIVGISSACTPQSSPAFTLRPSNSLLYLADPFSACPSHSTACRHQQPRQPRACFYHDVQPAPLSPVPSVYGHDTQLQTHKSLRASGGGLRHKEDHRRFHDRTAAPLSACLHEEVQRKPIDVAHYRDLPPQVPTPDRFREARWRERCHEDFAGISAASLRTRGAVENRPLVEGQPFSTTTTTKTTEAAAAGTESTRCGRREVRQKLRLRHENEASHSTATTLAFHTVQVAQPRYYTDDDFLEVQDVLPPPQLSVCDVEKQRPLKRHVHTAAAPPPKEAHSHGAVPLVPLKREERHTTYPVKERHARDESQQSTRVSQIALNSVAPLQSDGSSRRRERRYKDLLAPAWTPSSTSSRTPHESGTLARVATASAATSLEGSHEDDEESTTPQFTNNHSALDITVVSALSPSPNNCSPTPPSMQDRLGSAELAPKDPLTAPSPASSASPTHAARASCAVQHENVSNPPVNASGEVAPGSREVQDGVSPVSPSDAFSPPSVSPSLRGRLSFDTAAVPSPVLSTASFGEVGSLSPLPLPPPTTVKSEKVRSEGKDRSKGQRCLLVCAAESAAREWIEMDASVQLHHLACEERVCYRLAEAVQYRRRLREMPCHPNISLQPEDLVTAPANKKHEAANSKEEEEEESVVRSCDAEKTQGSDPLLTTPSLSAAKVPRRMPSVTSLPPLSPQGKATPIEEGGGADVTRDAISPSSPSSSSSSQDACSLSPSLEPRRADDGDAAPHGFRDEDGASQPHRCRPSSSPPLHEDDDLCDALQEETQERAGKVEDCFPNHGMGAADDWVTNSDESGAPQQEDDGSAAWEDEHDEARDSDGVEEEEKGAGETVIDGAAVVEATTSGAADASEPSSLDTVSSFDVTQHHEVEPRHIVRTRIRSPPQRCSAPTTLPAHHLQDLEDDEEDARYLLTGECPPPHVFRRWADRFLHAQRSPRGISPAPSPEAAAPAPQDATLSEVSPSDARSFSGNGRHSTGSPEAFLSTAKRRATAGQATAAETTAEPSFSPDNRRSISQQRLCSERNRARMFESFVGDVEEVRASGGALQPSKDGEPHATSEYNASGRDAPDPQIFSEENRLQESPFSQVERGDDSEAGVPSPYYTDGPSALNVTALPEESCAESVERTSDDSSERRLSPPLVVVEAEAVSAAATAAFAPFAYPSEKTYDVPFGSERDAWQELMDKFIEGLVKLMSYEV